MDKNTAIQLLQDKLQNEIISFYPLEKQLADEQQISCYSALLLAIKLSKDEDLNLNDILQVSLIHADEILSHKDNFQNIVNSYPEDERFYWEQIIKAQLRKLWVVKNVHLFTQLKNDILNDKYSADELEQIVDKYNPIIIPFPEV